MHFSKLTSVLPFALAGLASAGRNGHSSSASDLDGSLWSRAPAHLRARFDRSRASQALASASPLFNKREDWDPPSDLATALAEVWEHYEETYSNLFGFSNYGWDQLIANDGYLNVCVRWESSASVTAAERAQIATVYEQQYQKWFNWLYGYDNFPFSNISVSVVGWAVSDTSLLEGDTSDIDIYTDTDADGIPQCAESCGRYFHQDGDYTSCAGGEARHYDQSLWLTAGMDGGAGGDWGQRIGQEYYMDALEQENVHILEHEMGHTFGLDDFYDWTPTGQTSFIMLAGSAFEVTEFDGWMLRNWWWELSRERGWNTDKNSESEATTEASGSTPTTTSLAFTAPSEESSTSTTSAIETSTLVVPTSKVLPSEEPTSSTFPTFPTFPVSEETAELSAVETTFVAPSEVPESSEAVNLPSATGGYIFPAGTGVTPPFATSSGVGGSLMPTTTFGTVIVGPTGQPSSTTSSAMGFPTGGWPFGSGWRGWRGGRWGGARQS